MSSQAESTSFKRFIQKKWSSWLFLNSSSSNQWWYATVHILTATIGAGVLNLHYSMAALSWELGIIALLWFIVLSMICYSQMVEMHEIGDKRFDKYRDLGKHMLGDKLGFWLVVPFQFIIMIVVDIVYIITASASLKKIFSVCSMTWPWTLAFGGFQLLLCQLPDFTSLAFVSLIGATTAIAYSTISWIVIVAFNKKYHGQPLISQLPCYSPVPPSPPVRHGYMRDGHVVFQVFAALGQLVFSCSAGQNIACEIQATMPSSPERPSKATMWQGTLAAYSIIAFCYIPVAVAGYWLYGDEPPKHCIKHLKDCHLLISLDEPRWLIVFANILLVIHLCGSYQVYAMPLFNSLEDHLEKSRKISTTFHVRLMVRSLYVVFTTTIATLTSPYFTSWEAVVGGLANIPTSYLVGSLNTPRFLTYHICFQLPCILWMLHRKPRKLSLLWLGSLFCIVFAVAVAVTSTIGSVYNLVNYKQNFYKHGIP